MPTPVSVLTVGLGLGSRWWRTSCTGLGWTWQSWRLGGKVWEVGDATEAETLAVIGVNYTGLEVSCQCLNMFFFMAIISHSMCCFDGEVTMLHVTVMVALVVISYSMCYYGDMLQYVL